MSDLAEFALLVVSLTLSVRFGWEAMERALARAKRHKTLARTRRHDRATR